MRSLVCLIAALAFAACYTTPEVGFFPTDTTSDSVATGDTDTADDTAPDSDDDAADSAADIAADSEADGEDDTAEDVPFIDVSEAFCECDDDCLPLGDGSLCNGTVCTFGVAGTPCNEPGDVGRPDVEDVGEDPIEDVEEDADTTPDVETDDVVPDVEEDPDAVVIGGIDIVYETAGGFTGEGSRDIRVVDGVMFIDEPFGTDCDDTLSAGQMTRLIDAAGIVDWESTAASYRPSDNPTCCCDQFLYALTVILENDAGAEATWEVDWCDESIGSLLPLSIDTFVRVLNNVADELAADCI